MHGWRHISIILFFELVLYWDRYYSSSIQLICANELNCKSRV